MARAAEKCRKPGRAPFPDRQLCLPAPPTRAHERASCLRPARPDASRSRRDHGRTAHRRVARWQCRSAARGNRHRARFAESIRHADCRFRSDDDRPGHERACRKHGTRRASVPRPSPDGPDGHPPPLRRRRPRHRGWNGIPARSAGAQGSRHEHRR